ncbi:MAG: hypothetical protein EOP45_21805 [Sphingobacteriaceae bacterium]|nr:MAG: hypothetical protein EOP45_21805 [Sphingobacteriaceae bacterium]
MQVAEQLNLPVFLHCRDAFEDFHRIISKYPKVPKCVHCHTDDDANHLQQLLQLDCFIGITGWVCDNRRGKGLASLMNMIPLNRLFVETDGPFLLPRNMPQPYPKENEAAYLGWVVKGISDVTGIVEKEIAVATTKNAIDFFNLK